VSSLATRWDTTKAINKVAIGTGGFRFASLTDAYDPMLLPGAVKYGDVPGLLALIAPSSLWLSGEGATAPSIVAKSYEANTGAQLTSYSGPPNNEAAEAVKWLLTGLPKETR
jgi:hypothetical protein